LTRSHYLSIFKRRRQGKTDYRKRRGMIIGGKPFLTIRVSNKYVYGQILKPTTSGDLTLCESSSRNLGKSYGWKGAPKNLPAAYLTGYLLGKKALKSELSEATVYSGVARFVHGSRMASFLGGVKDAGLNLEVDEESLPEEGRMKGGHIATYASKLEAEDKSLYQKRFSRILSSGSSPSDISKNFDDVKSTIEKGFS
jgi:large subunit ribosomal protein L18